jgi:hypothetical protein
MAAFCFLRWEEVFAAIFFAYMAYQSYQMLQQVSGGGFGGRGW